MEVERDNPPTQYDLEQWEEAQDALWLHGPNGYEKYRRQLTAEKTGQVPLALPEKFHVER